MTIHRFFISEVNPEENILILPSEVSHQITKVLRLKKGDVIVVFDKNQTEYMLMLEEVQRQEVTGRIIKKEENKAEPHIKIHLYQSLLPREKFEDVLQKATQLGVTTFSPIETERAIVKAKDMKEEKLQRWQKIIQEASEQSERGVVPTIHKTLSFTDAVLQANREGIAIIAWENEENNFPTIVLDKVKDVIKETLLEKRNPVVSLFIGPEGGFTEQEILFAKTKDVQTISLGPRILKSETAGIILTTLVFFSLGDLDRSAS